MKVMTETDLGLADSYIDGDFSFKNKYEGLLKLIMGNEHFALFLDESMTLSCAVFKTRINEKHEVLDIGCGWGILAIEIVKRTGYKYTSINLVEVQLKYAEMRLREAGLQNLLAMNTWRSFSVYENQWLKMGSLFYG
ncbi:hypothetical protein ACOSQ2_014234 [Xanthoceras sorbifolium]